MSYSYICSGISIINDIRYADGSSTYNRLGGSIFAYTGIALFTDSVIYISSGGPDYFDFYGNYFKENGIDPKGITISMPHTHHTLLQYEADGTWHEDSIYGPTYFADQSDNVRTTLKKLKPFLSEETKGLYLDSHAYEGIFREIPEIRTIAPDMKILWEPPTLSSTNPAYHELILEDLKQVDYYSMNLNEASIFFSASARDEIISRIMELNIPCFLREGENGSSWIEDHEITSLGAYRPEEAVDVTGCGNCSSAAALYWKTATDDPEQIVMNANIASKFNSMSDGPFAVKKARDERAYLPLQKIYMSL